MEQQPSTNLEDNLDNASPEVAVDKTSTSKKILLGIGNAALSVGDNIINVLYMTPEQRTAKRKRNELEVQVQLGKLTPDEADEQAREFARDMRRSNY